MSRKTTIASYRFHLRSLVAACCLVLCVKFVAAQSPPLQPQSCTVTVNSFPYHETFEAGDGNWTAGGTASDWAWGTPVKPVITAAGEGAKCWQTGGLSGSAYNNGESSWLESPCFNFSSLANPRISFKIFWETERKFDGATFQYSTDDGASWLIVGSINSNSNCQGQNWYNSSSVTYLGNQVGWSGNVQSSTGSCLGGTGSGQWLPAIHTLSNLAGRPSVKFRFQFASGTTCNAFDGFAVDDILIEEAPVNQVTVSHTCRNSNTVDFAASALCAQSYSWTFGDAASGTNNTSSSANPSHQFSGPGQYNVSLTTTFATGAPVVTNTSLYIIAVTAGIVDSISCHGATDGNLAATATGASAYTYSWNSNPPANSPGVSGLGVGGYTVTVNANNACSASASIQLIEPAILQLTTSIKDAGCTANTGAITATVTGGTTAYQYTWSNGATSSSINNIAPGSYDVTVTDQHGCTVNASGLQVKTTASTLSINLGADDNICPGETLLLNPGNFSSYLWQDNSNNPTFTVRNTGLYYVTVEDAGGCSAADSIYVTVDCSGIYFPTAFTPNGDGRNDGFGPLGNLAALKNFTMTVYNRYGEQVFFCDDPFKKWNGNFKSATQNTFAYTWVSQFIYNGKPEIRKGTVLILK